MDLVPGGTLSHYRLVAKIGEGGMGVVYEALDSTLNRHVAIKVLPDLFLHDPDRVARFDREAKLLASLNHPNVAGIYGFEEAGGIRFLVLELVPGETLAERLTRGSLAVDEALAVCRQIAEGLEAAHEKGIIHRDLKPGNVKLTPDGKVKVLDFGLAKAFGDDSTGTNLTKSPTMTAQATLQGVILGTAAYMSPEAARAKPVDRRTDIWSFGCVLFEALTGRQAFEGETVSDTLAAILTRDPDWQALPANLPGRIGHLLQRCLHKDSNRRLRDIGEARIEMEEALSGPRPATLIAPAQVRGGVAGDLARPAPGRRSIPWIAAGALALGAALIVAGGVWMLTRTAASPPTQVMRFSLALPATEPLVLAERPAVALSPDGTHLVYVAAHEGETQLYLRALDRLEATPIQGTQGATNPFFSPDGQWVGFFSDGRLKKVALQGGPPVALCDASQSRGAAWGADDTILFAPTFISGLSRVSAAGGTPRILTSPDSKSGERTHRWPEILPGGQAVLFTIGSLASPDYYLDSRIAVQSLKTGKMKIVIEGGTNARYASSGHIVYASVGGLFAAPFDPVRLEVTGPSVPILEGVMMDTTTGAAQFALSISGSLLYAPGEARAPDRTLIWVDRKGSTQPLTAPPHPYREPRLSPDGKRLALTINSTRNDDVWVYDFARGALSRLTFEGSNAFPLWTPDGKRIVHQSERGSTIGLFWTAVDGSGSEERLTTSQTLQIPESWSPDGGFLAFRQIDPKTGDDIWILPLEGERKPRPFRQTAFDESGAKFSPDGRWIAYVSFESGRPEVYVQAFPGPGGKWQISTEGGSDPQWARDGRELFYLREDKMMSVSITTQPTFTASAPRLLFQRRYAGGLVDTSYDVTADGRRFIMVQGSEQEQVPTQLTLVLGWLGELDRRVPKGTK